MSIVETVARGCCGPFVFLYEFLRDGAAEREVKDANDAKGQEDMEVDALVWFWVYVGLGVRTDEDPRGALDSNLACSCENFEEWPPGEDGAEETGEEAPGEDGGEESLQECESG